MCRSEANYETKQEVQGAGTWKTALHARGSTAIVNTLMGVVITAKIKSVLIMTKIINTITATITFYI